MLSIFLALFVHFVYLAPVHTAHHAPVRVHASDTTGGPATASTPAPDDTTGGPA